MDSMATIARELPRLRRFARALTGETSAADDLVQDTLERALRRRSQLRRQDKPRSWLFKIMHNIHRDRFRAEGRRPKQVDSDDDLPGRELSESPRQIGLIFARDVLEALSALPTDRREVLALVAVEGCSYREAADILGIPVGTLMSRLARARKQLRAELDAIPERQETNIRSLR